MAAGVRWLPLGGVTMSLHKLTAGSGYDYLTRQVAALDATEKGHASLASYYTEKGETPGVWVGSGLVGIEGLAAGDVVTAEQMQALFGSGHHPLARERAEALPDGASDREVQAVTRLGQPYRVYTPDVSPFRAEVARRIEQVNTDAGLPGDWPVPARERARIRTEVATEFFASGYGRDPSDARELAGFIAAHSRPRTTAVAGYDLTFSPVKSVSVLWALADPQVATRVERAHQAAVRDALAFLEQHALFTRVGTDGVRQVEVTGLVATAFTHRDSRAGDPDLHTHVAVANKVQTADGRWLAIDGRVLFKANVSASETYNTALERHLTAALGVRFAARTEPARGRDPRRPVREIVGIPAALLAAMSSRRHDIEHGQGQLAAAFQTAHGRPPTPVEALQLAQQATLETRQGKHEPRRLVDQRRAWRDHAAQVLGGADAVDTMVGATLAPIASEALLTPRPDVVWVRETAEQVAATLEEHRSTWQVWHVYAEAQRRVRECDLPADQVQHLVGLLVDHVLVDHSVPLSRPDGLVEPEMLRRRDGSSQFAVAGADLYSSARIMAAERRLVETAGLLDGRVVPSEVVDVALLEATANGIRLNPGQAALVRQMATSGARLQLAIAPAGSGKTTAMRALATAWTDAGGTVIGLAPSAAAASALRDQIDSPTDTLAKLVWHLRHDPTPRSHPEGSDSVPADMPADMPADADEVAWIEAIGPDTLVVIDEAGMADTLALDTVVSYVTARGGSVRLVGDDHQLAAIGAGGVLRDLQATHGAVRLTELLRFADPAEGAATLALREGHVEALGFYLDHDRVHVGDLATVTDDLFEAWRAGRTQGLDAVMLAPTRDLVRELNQRARAHRLEATNPPGAPTPGLVHGPDTQVVRLADGNDASVGDLLLTRVNDRTLRTSPTDWVKNGDRWHLLDHTPDGGLVVQHTQNRARVTLPPAYVATAVELGYASTIHTAQGISADTMHGLATGEESRQQLYTMLTRGRLANHVYLEVVGDGDPHSMVRPEVVHPRTPTDLLEQILARDAAAVSATTLARTLADPATRLGQATTRYAEALYVAAADLLGEPGCTQLAETAERLVPGVTAAPAWPALRSHLLLLTAHRADLESVIARAVGGSELATARDSAAVLDWRLDDTGHRSTGTGPLPWLPTIPTALHEHPHWGGYLTARAHLVTTAAHEVHARSLEATSEGTKPAWHRPAMSTDPATVAQVEVWRAATSVEPTDRRPTGPPVLQKAAQIWRAQLNDRIRGDHAPALMEWRPLLTEILPHRGDSMPGAEDFLVELAERLAAVSRAGIDAAALARRCAHQAPLPDDHAAAALWWRITGQLAPAVATQLATDHTLTTGWTPRLAELLDPGHLTRLQASPAWPALVATLDQALQRGWRLEDLLPRRSEPCTLRVAVAEPGPGAVPDAVPGAVTGAAPFAGSGTAGQDECEALVWRSSLILQPLPDLDPLPDPATFPPEDLHDLDLPSPDNTWGVPPTQTRAGHPDETRAEAPGGTDVEGDLARATLLRSLGSPLGQLEPSDADVARQLSRAQAWDDAPVSRIRMLQINELACTFFENRLHTSWSRSYLLERFGRDLSGHPDIRPGHAPAGWTSLLTHLHRTGVTDEEMLACGLATRASTGRLIDRFRDRLVFPILHPTDLEAAGHLTHHGVPQDAAPPVEVLGFIARRNPDLAEADLDHAGPKYLNTAQNPLFHKGAQLYGVLPHHLATGGIPVLVEGPTDAIAVTLATAGTHVGVACLGTALTSDQATQLHALSVLAGRQPIVATDPDPAGQHAATRAFWALAAHGLDPRLARLPAGIDPADLHHLRGPAGVAALVHDAQPLGLALLHEHLTRLRLPGAERPGLSERVGTAVQILAALPPDHWDHGAATISHASGLTQAKVRALLRDEVDAWDADPRVAADTAAARATAGARDRALRNGDARYARSADPQGATTTTRTPAPSPSAAPSSQLPQPHRPDRRGSTPGYGR